MSGYGGFVRGAEHTDEAQKQQQTTGTGVVILAPKQAAKPSGELDVRPSNILNVRKALQKSAVAGARSPDSPPAERRRASPSYEAFKPRSSPTYEPLNPRGSPSYKPQETTAAAGLQNGQHDAAAAAGIKPHSRSRSSSRSRHRRRQSSSREDRKRRRHSRSSSPRHRSRDRHHSRHDSNRNKRHKRSRSRSRSRRRHSSRHKSSRRSRSRNRSREGSYRQHDSRHSSRSDRQRSPSPIPFSRQEKSRAWADERAYNTETPVRRGKQGLGFGHQQQQQREGDEYNATGRERSNRATAAANSSRGVSTLDAAAMIPGYEYMTAAEKLKARMRLVMSKAEQQGAAAEDAAAGVGSGMVGHSDSSDVGNNGWTRFVFDRHGEMDEDKQARQKLMDAEVGQVAMSGFGNAADHTLDTAAAFIMGTGRVAAQREGIAKAAEAAHDDAIFGRPYGGSVAAKGAAAGAPLDHQQEQQQHGGKLQQTTHDTGFSNSGVDQADNHCHDDTKQLAASLGVSEVLIVEQQKPGLSWRDRALAMRAKKQQ